MRLRNASIWLMLALGVLPQAVCDPPQSAARQIVQGTVLRGGKSAGAEIVVWLTPLDPGVASQEPAASEKATLLQKNKRFSPHLLVVPVGTVVEFPNADPFFHNVFSMFNGKRFDLGLYESGSRRSVHFDREGVSLIFCNIHPEMGAVVVALKTPYFGTTDASGHLVIRGVPDGRYRVSLWSEHFEMDPNHSDRTLTVSGAAASLGALSVTPKSDPLLNHKNKFGEDYMHTPAPQY